MLCWISPGQKLFVAWATTWYKIVLEMLKPIKHAKALIHTNTPLWGVSYVIVSIQEQLERQQTAWWVVKGYEGVLIWEEMKGEADCGASRVWKCKTKQAVVLHEKHPSVIAVVYSTYTNVNGLWGQLWIWVMSCNESVQITEACVCVWLATVDC